MGVRPESGDSEAAQSAVVGSLRGSIEGARVNVEGKSGNNNSESGSRFGGTDTKDPNSESPEPDVVTLFCFT